MLAASRYQLEAIETARRLGYRVVTIDNVPSNPGHALADCSYDVDIIDRAAVLNIARQERVDGAIAVATDVAVPTRAFVTEQLGLPGPNLQAVETVCDKTRMRAFLHEEGLPAPAMQVVDAQTCVSPSTFVDQRQILKPDRSSGAKGVRIVDSPAAYARQLPETLAWSPTGRAVLEQFVDGHQGTCEGVLMNGEIVAAYFLDRQTAAAPYVTTAGHRVPSRLPGTAQAELLRQLRHIWSVLNVRDGPFDCDFVATRERVFVLDLSPRIGGNSIARLLRVAANFDLVKYGVMQACGDAANPPTDCQIRPAALMVFGVDRPGRLEYDETAAASLAEEPWVQHCELDAARGSLVEAFINSRHRVGEAIIVGKSRDEVDAHVNELTRRLGVHAV